VHTGGVPIPVLLDCDPGHDDALAIMLAAGSPALDLRLVTTVAGNQSLAKTTLNARRVLSAAGIREVPVAAGCDRPLAGDADFAEDIHGESGLDGPSFGEVTVPLLEEHAVDVLARTLAEAPEPLTLVATGPLTNVATLLREHPRSRERIHRLVLMGGSTGRGNYRPYAEFNVAFDPEAADVVLRSGLDVTMVGLDVTHQALATPQVLERFAALGTPLARVCVDLMTFFAATYRAVFGFEAPPLHDPVALALLIDPGVVTTVGAPVAVELTGEHTRGATVVDLHHRTGAPDNARVGLDLDADRFWDLVLDAVARLGA
jgi:purine nucleosidase/pyrimidine-specific ribonucleoside hydrolase